MQGLDQQADILVNTPQRYLESPVGRGKKFVQHWVSGSCSKYSIQLCVCSLTLHYYCTCTFVPALVCISFFEKKKRKEKLPSGTAPFCNTFFISSFTRTATTMVKFLFWVLSRGHSSWFSYSPQTISLRPNDTWWQPLKKINKIHRLSFFFLSAWILILPLCSDYDRSG